MQSSLLGILMMVAVVFVGLAIGVRIGKTSIQKQAAVWAFVTLGVLVIVFCVTAIVLSWWWTPDVIAVACIIVPLIVYVAVVMALSSSKRQAKRPHHEEVLPAPSAEETSGDSDTTQAEVDGVLGEKAAVVDLVEPEESIGSSDSAERAESSESSEVMHPIEQAGAIDPEEPTTSEQPELTVDELGKPAEPTEHKKSVEMSQSVEAATPITPEKPAQSVNSEIVAEPIDSMTSESVVVSAARQFDASHYFDRASVLRDKGLFVVAARLYVECAELADDPNIVRKARFEQLTCYVRADMRDQAHELALALKALPSLSVGEAMKLDLVLKEM